MTSNCNLRLIGRGLTEQLGPLFCINLAYRKDRRAEISAELEKIGLVFDDCTTRLFSAVRPESAAGFPSIGAHGCFLSHLSVLRIARDEGLTAIVVCEDDLDFADDFIERFPLALKRISELKWDIFYGGYSKRPGGDVVDSESGLIRVQPAEAIQNTHFLAFRGDVIIELINYLEAILSRPPGHPDGGPMHVDGALSRFRRDHPERVTLSVDPPLGVQRASRTDIHTLRWFDRFPVIRNLAQAFRRIGKSLQKVKIG